MALTSFANAESDSHWGIRDVSRDITARFLRRIDQGDDCLTNMWRQEGPRRHELSEGIGVFVAKRRQQVTIVFALL